MGDQASEFRDRELLVLDQKIAQHFSKEVTDPWPLLASGGREERGERVCAREIERQKGSKLKGGSRAVA
jgi:hypothetical protein